MATITETAVATGKFPSKENIKWHDLPTPEEPDVPLPPPSVSPTAILDVDKGTPDSHVPRDPRLIRLTGVHPFNVEPPLTALYKEGMRVLKGHILEHWANYARVSHISRAILCPESRPCTSDP